MNDDLLKQPMNTDNLLEAIQKQIENILTQFEQIIQKNLDAILHNPDQILYILNNIQYSLWQINLPKQQVHEIIAQIKPIIYNASEATQQQLRPIIHNNSEREQISTIIHSNLETVLQQVVENIPSNTAQLYIGDLNSEIKQAFLRNSEETKFNLKRSWELFALIEHIRQKNSEAIQQNQTLILEIIDQFTKTFQHILDLEKESKQICEILNHIYEILWDRKIPQQLIKQIIPEITEIISKKLDIMWQNEGILAQIEYIIWLNTEATQQNPEQQIEIILAQINDLLYKYQEARQQNPEQQIGIREIISVISEILHGNLKRPQLWSGQIIAQIEPFFVSPLEETLNQIQGIYAYTPQYFDAKPNQVLEIIAEFRPILRNILDARQQNLKKSWRIQKLFVQMGIIGGDLEATQQNPEQTLKILNQIQQILSQISQSPTPPSAVASFRRSYPIDFSLYDGEQQNVLYINDNPTDQNLKIEILNTSQQNIELDALDKTPNANSHHFELRFRPGTLSTASLPQIALADGSNWHMSCLQNNSNGTVSFYFSSTTRPTITSGGKIDLTLKGVGADPSGGARGTRVELKYRNLKYQGSPNSFNGSRVEHISIVAHRGRKNIPLHMGFVGSNTILNDGSSPSELTLRITNTLKRNPSNPASSNIMFSKDTSAPSKFIISFDSGDENKEWALGTNSQVNNIKVKVNFPQDSQWIEINNSNVGSSAEWTINIPESLPQLDASQFIQIKLSEIITGHSSGHTNVYVHYENISGYWDGQFVCTIEKCPLLYRGGNVGIGIANQLNAKLDIRVKQDDSTNALRVGKENSDYLTVLNDGNVGIGTTNPSEKLEVAGNIKSSGLSVSGNVSIGTITTNSRAKLYVDGRIKDKTGDVMPVGSILPYAGEQAPEGWLFCDGQSYNQFDNKYADLYQVIQNKYGRDGNKFKVPDLKGRVPVGYGDGSFGGIGNIGGAKTHTLGINEMPSHAHNVTDQGHFHNVPCYEYASSTGGIDEGGGDAVTRRVDTNTVQTGISIEIKGGGQAHNNLQPYLTVNFIIKC